ncbi:hypothetical protein WDU94_000839 [Cyamophila willieti]
MDFVELMSSLYFLEIFCSVVCCYIGLIFIVPFAIWAFNKSAEKEEAKKNRTTQKPGTRNLKRFSKKKTSTIAPKAKNGRDVSENPKNWTDTSNLSFVKYVDINVTEMRETQLGSQLFVDGKTKELSSNVTGVLLNTSMLVATIPFVEILAALIQTDEALLSNAPDEYLDSIMNTIMIEPVILPSSRQTLDKSTIAR